MVPLHHETATCREGVLLAAWFWQRDRWPGYLGLVIQAAFFTRCRSLVFKNWRFYLHKSGLVAA